MTVNNYTYVHVQNNVIIDGAIIVETQGSFVQTDDGGTVTLNTGGAARVIKETAILN